MPNSSPSSKPTQNHNGTLDLSALERWQWDAACTIREPLDAPQGQRQHPAVDLPQRLSDVFEYEVSQHGENLGSPETGEALVEVDHSLVRNLLPANARWSSIEIVTTGLGQALTDVMRAVSRENPQLAGVIDVTDYYATSAGERETRA